MQDQEMEGSMGGTTAISELGRLDIASAIDTNHSPLLTSAEAFEQNAQRVARDATAPSDTASISAMSGVVRVGRGKVAKVADKEAWQRLTINSKLTTWLTRCPEPTRIRLQRELERLKKDTVVRWMDKWVEDMGVSAIDDYKLAPIE